MKPKNIIGRIFSRNATFIILLILQILFLVYAVVKIGEKFYFVYLFLIVLDIALVIYIMNTDDHPSYKLAWVISINVFPLFGGLAYLYIKHSKKFPRNVGKPYKEQANDYLIQNSDTMKMLKSVSRSSSNLAHYVSAYGPYPVYQHSEAVYFPLGELQFEALITELEKAEKFIFMEYFIISEGYMFDTISELLIRKAAEGVDVRLMYDGIGTGMLNSSKPFKRLKEQGIKCKAFNPFTPFLSSVQNNRDHRKIIVIDGHTAFNGGTNLADEYINHIERFGHWKDTAVMIRGAAVWNYTVMFLQMWNVGEKHITDFESFIPPMSEITYKKNDGFIQPFSFSPLDDEPIGKKVYLDLINNAVESVSITTPYLVLDDEILSALQLAAEKGVNVRIITPHIPDKWYVHVIAWNNYPKLISSGVKVYEYTPGFIHAKTLIADGQTAVVGTINLDYRSFYLHFESAAILYSSSAIDDMVKDFEETIKISQLITAEECQNRPLYKKMLGFILQTFAPLL